jgi:hypothetical protein
LNTNELEPIYYNAANALLKGTAKKPADVFKILKPIYVDDPKFQQDFESLELAGQRKKLTKYILCCLETRAAGKPCNYETDPSSIEHILPENPSAKWDEVFQPDGQKEYTYRVGNLTLLETSLNRRISNQDFSSKLSVYKKSSYALTHDLGTEIEWTPARLLARQKKLADWAVHLWRSDFA